MDICPILQQIIGDRRMKPNRCEREFGWGARIRTWEWRNQNPLPYHLATPHRAVGLPIRPLGPVGRPHHSGVMSGDQRWRRAGYRAERPDWEDVSSYRHPAPAFCLSMSLRLSQRTRFSRMPFWPEDGENR